MGMDDADTKAIAAVDAVVCGDDAAADCVAADAVVADPMNESSMGLGAHLYKNTTYDSGINSLFALGFTFSDKGKATISVNSDNHWNWQTRFHALSLSIKGLTEFHDINTVLTQSRTHGRAGVCFASAYLQLDICRDFLSHLTSPLGSDVSTKTPTPRLHTYQKGMCC